MTKNNIMGRIIEYSITGRFFTTNFPLDLILKMNSNMIRNCKKSIIFGWKNLFLVCKNWFFYIVIYKIIIKEQIIIAYGPIE